MGKMDGQAVVVGIDEAGYGPLLGPLVVSAVVFRVPAEMVRVDWWDRLRATVAPAVRAREPRLVVTDSKELSRRADAMRWLERPVLTFLSLPDGQGRTRTFPPSFRGLLGQLDRDVLRALDGHPWYQDADFELPVANARNDILIQQAAVRSSMSQAGMTFVAARSAVLVEGEFNRLVKATRNKSVVLLGQTIRLIQRVMQSAHLSHTHVFIDKQGGRQSYVRPLMTAFEDAHLEIVTETDTRSAYRLTGAGGLCEIEFVQEGEKHHMPIALASIYSKYVRELFMRAFNAFWRRHVPTVSETAGYYTDGKRFLKAIEPAIARLGVSRELLVRIR